MRKVRTGSPTGRVIKSHEYRPEWHEVETFIFTNRDHPAIIAGQEFLQNWIDASILRKNVAGYQHIRHLNDMGVTPLQILHEVLAVSLFSHRNEAKLPLGEPYRRALAYSVLRLGGYLRKNSSSSTGKKYMVSLPGGMRQKVGLFLWENLSTLILNAVATLQETQAKHEKLVGAMGMPFKAPGPVKPLGAVKPLKRKLPGSGRAAGRDVFVKEGE
jgi:hypothetical protein